MGGEAPAVIRGSKLAGKKASSGSGTALSTLIAWLPYQSWLESGWLEAQAGKMQTPLSAPLQTDVPSGLINLASSWSPIFAPTRASPSAPPSKAGSSQVSQPV